MMILAMIIITTIKVILVVVEINEKINAIIHQICQNKRSSEVQNKVRA